MKKIILALFICFAISGLALAATCDPNKLSQEIVEKMGKLQNNPEIVAKLEKPLAEQMGKLEAIQKTGNIEEFCKTLTDINTLLDQGEK